jgi:hypothetical protein
LLECIIEHENVISGNTEYDENNHDLEESKIFDLENDASDESSSWVTQQNDTHSK